MMFAIKCLESSQLSPGTLRFMGCTPGDPSLNKHLVHRGGVTMTRSFVETRRERWQRLYDLLRKAEKAKLTSFTPQGLIGFSVLYRQAATDLAAAEPITSPKMSAAFSMT